MFLNGIKLCGKPGVSKGAPPLLKYMEGIVNDLNSILFEGEVTNKPISNNEDDFILFHVSSFRRFMQDDKEFVKNTVMPVIAKKSFLKLGLKHGSKVRVVGRLEVSIGELVVIHAEHLEIKGEKL